MKKYEVKWYDVEIETCEVEIVEAENEGAAMDRIYQGMGDDAEDIICGMEVKEVK